MSGQMCLCRHQVQGFLISDRPGKRLYFTFLHDFLGWFCVASYLSISSRLSNLLAYIHGILYVLFL